MTDVDHPSGLEGAVPVDISEWFDGDEAARDSIAAAVDHVCTTSGFLALTGHGVSRELMTRMLEVSGQFFDLPLETKMRYRPGDLAANRGYSPEGVEALAYSLGDATPPDMFEAFNIGREVAPPGVPPDVIASYYAPNLWPV